MLIITVTVEAPGHMAQSVKESVGAAAEIYGAARVTSVRETPSGESQCVMESIARPPWDATRTKKGVA